MEETWIAERGKLRGLLNSQVKLSICQLAAQCGHSRTWIKKWKKRLKNSPVDDLSALRSRSRRRHELPITLDKRIESAILEIRDQPPVDLNRVPGGYGRREWGIIRDGQSKWKRQISERGLGKGELAV